MRSGSTETEAVLCYSVTF